MRRTLPLLALAAALLVPSVAAASPFEPLGDQLRISRTGADSDNEAFAANKAVGYNERDDRYLVVWDGRESATEARRLFGQVLDGGGTPIGDRRVIADVGPDGTTPFDARSPSVVWNPDANEFLVVWAGRPEVGDGRDIFARRVSPDGSPLGSQPTRVSDTGPAATADRDASEPSVAYNGANDEYLVVWAADDTANLHIEIYGQRLTPDASPVGADDFRISRTGSNDTVQTLNVSARVAYDTRDNEYLVAWRGLAGAAGTGSAVRGQRLSPEGDEVGPDDFRVSNPNGPNGFSIFDVGLAYNPDDDTYLVAYDSRTQGGETEIRAQRTAGTVAPVGDEIQVSDMGPEGDTAREAEDPNVIFNRRRGEYVVVWNGDDGADDDFEVFAQRLTAQGAATGANDVRVSFTGAEGEQIPFAGDAHIAFGSRRDEYLVVWDANPGAAAGLGAEKFEIFARRLGDGSEAPPPPPPGGGGGQPAPPPAPVQQEPGQGDATPPLLRLQRSRAQRVLRQGGVKVTATADEDSLFTARGTIALPERAAATLRLTGARTRTRTRRARLTLRLPRRHRAAVARALRRRKSLKATVTVIARNEAGLTRTRRIAVRLVR
jgi:hypothetical protein